MQSHKDQEDVVLPTDTSTLSTKAQKNQAMLELLIAELKRNPERDMFMILRKIQNEIDPPKKIETSSSKASDILASYMDPSLIGKKKQLVGALKCMISASTTVWEQDLKGTVLKFSDEIAAKIVRENTDYTEYTSLQYLKEHAPDLPIPKSHGLIKFSNVCIMLMTYIPTTTLENNIFSTLRALKLPTGQNMGGVNGEGVQDFLMDDHETQHLNTISAFEDFQFSIDPSHPGYTPNIPSPAFTTFLRKFLPPSTKDCVFTHSDVRPANIIVAPDPQGGYKISGIIDWEMSGFYPEYVESMQVLHLFNRNVEND